MNIEKVLPYFHPPILDQYIHQTRTDIEVARLSTLPEPRISLRSQFETTLSLNTTLAEMNAGRLASLVDIHKKPHATFLCDSFVVSEALPQRTVYLGERRDKSGYTSGAQFYIDGKHGFGLGFREDGMRRPLWLAVASFSSGREIPAVTNSEAGETVLSPVIIQLQGSSYTTYQQEATKEKASAILRQLHWEKMLVNIIMEWAHENQIPDLYILPSAKNRWASEERLKRFKIRYDATAEHMGFKMHGNGLYGFSLL